MIHASLCAESTAIEQMSFLTTWKRYLMLTVSHAVQFEAAGAPQQLSGTSAASRCDYDGQAAESSSSVAADKGTDSHEQASQSTSTADMSQAQQAAAGNGADPSAEQQSFLFSNPTFESYLDSPSDDELAPVEGCTTPRSAIKQQASRFLVVFLWRCNASLLCHLLSKRVPVHAELTNWWRVILLFHLCAMSASAST